LTLLQGTNKMATSPIFIHLKNYLSTAESQPLQNSVASSL
jgi:hypothetical protein